MVRLFHLFADELSLGRKTSLFSSFSVTFLSFSYCYLSTCLILFTFRKTKGASQGRGPRAAGWFADYIDDQKSKSTETDIEMASHVLTGGIKGWVAGGQDFTTFMDEYVAEKWTDV